MSVHRFVNLAICMGAAIVSEFGNAHAAATDDPWIGKVAPDFALTTLDGRIVKLSSLRGKVVLLNFWATWCAPCRVEMPDVAALGRQYQSQGLEIVGVAMDDDDRDGVAKFVRDRHIDYRILLKNSAVSDAYGGLRYLPQTFFIDRTGKILGRTYGLRTREQLETDIRRGLHARRRTQRADPGAGDGKMGVAILG
jgi:peroxiredoxin